MFTIGAVDGERSYRVAVDPLDAIMDAQGLAHVELIKMDIEGAELKALQGATHTLRSARPVILIELNDRALARSGASSSDIVALLRSEGYLGWIVTRTGARKLLEPEAHDCDECLFVHKKHHELVSRLKLPQ